MRSYLRKVAWAIVLGIAFFSGSSRTLLGQVAEAGESGSGGTTKDSHGATCD